MTTGKVAFGTLDPIRCAKGVVLAAGNDIYDTPNAGRSVKSSICPAETPLGAHSFANGVSKAACQLGKRLLRHTEQELVCQKRRVSLGHAAFGTQNGNWCVKSGVWAGKGVLPSTRARGLARRLAHPAFRWVPGFAFRGVPKCGGFSTDSSTCGFVGREREPAFRWVPGFAFQWVPGCGVRANAAWQAEDTD